MRFGIKDYILKPGKKEEIIKALQRIKKEITAERSHEIEKVHSKSLLKERFIAHIMRYPITEKTLEMRKRLYPKAKYRNFFAISADEHLQMQHIKTAITSLFKNSVILQDSDQYAAVLVLYEEQIENKKLLTLCGRFHMQTGKNGYIGIGTSRKIEKLPSSYNEAYAACFQLKSANKRRYGFLNDGEERKDLQQEIIEEICSRIEKEMDKKRYCI